MGLEDFVHGMAWFITSFVQLTFSVSVVTVILVFSKVLAHSDPLLIWILLEIYAVATITFSFLVSSFFSRAKLASATAGMVYFLSYIPSLSIGLQEDVVGVPVPLPFKILTSFLSTSAFGFSCKYIGLRESEGTGVHWDNISTSPVEHDSFSLLISTCLLIFDVFLYAILAWYFDNVKPGRYGIPKPWYFLFTSSYWRGIPHDKSDAVFKKLYFSLKSLIFKDKKIEENYPMVIADDNNVEDMPLDMPKTVEIAQLRKVYEGKKLALDNLSVDFYEGHVTSLLGHNGAGKTTTMNILTGTIPPSSGTVRICGNDISSNLSQSRRFLGYCPQHNALFDHLTPVEHLWFFNNLKQNSKPISDSKVLDILADIELSHKQTSIVQHFSGGMKRKLAIAIAFLGDPKLVVLDEPTAGVDPHSRRKIWEVILKNKSNRTVLMSTHHMEEADALSDRIAIVSKGNLKCCGSSLFIRNKFCEGYHWVCIIDDLAKQSELIERVEESLPSARLVSEVFNELHFIIPYEEERNGNLQQFFHSVDLTSVGIVSHGIFDSTLEDAFLRVTGKSQKLNNSISSSSLLTSPVSESSVFSTDAFVHAKIQDEFFLAREFRHFSALLIKRFINVRRSWKTLFTQILLPAIFVATAMSLSFSCKFPSFFCIV